MNFWFLSDPKRLSLERDEIKRLQSTSTWLEGIEWALDNGITLKAQIKAHGHLYEVKLIYPAFFPSTPPTVKPLGDEVRWSNHQYSNGALCLEWGPDNWHSSITGAQVLESAYRLIHTENPLGNPEQKGSAPSRHFLTEGQNLRNKIIRLYAEADFLDVLSALHEIDVANIKFAIVFENKTMILHVVELEKSGGAVWVNSTLPNKLKPAEDHIGLVLKTKLPLEKIKEIRTVNDVEELYDVSSVKPLSDVKLIIVLDEENKPHVLFSFKSDEELFTIPLIFAKKQEQRLPDYLRSLEDKKIGIVGLGSLGSKVALSLARMGVAKFYLVDDDIFLPGNIVRHTLDWKSVATHKVDAIENQLKYIASSIEVEVAKTNVAGQEATTTLNAVLSKLGNCDLIIDATANARVFNFLSAASITYEKPMVWGEVFAGGIGGLIARSRPNTDPDPQTMRSAFYEITQQTPEFEFATVEPYGIEDGVGQVMVASDADVSVIASHLTRLVADTVLETDLPIFPYSMYLIGLSKSWIFEEPFDTRPIQTDHLPKHSKKQEATDEEWKGTVEFIQSLLEKRNDKSITS
jgi:molybdopterin/thiamine biosynthesis adenylyltransferase/ubiquitin-protein ligase